MTDRQQYEALKARLASLNAEHDRLLAELAQFNQARCEDGDLVPFAFDGAGGAQLDDAAFADDKAGNE